MTLCKMSFPWTRATSAFLSSALPLKDCQKRPLPSVSQRLWKKWWHRRFSLTTLRLWQIKWLEMSSWMRLLWKWKGSHIRQPGWLLRRLWSAALQTSPVGASLWPVLRSPMVCLWWLWWLGGWVTQIMLQILSASHQKCLTAVYHVVIEILGGCRRSCIAQ